ncbi:MAG: aminoacyl-tRNA deacylase [Desulfuromonadales bacterium C00003068]|jgi:Cys-tRNA(Pro) deacylase|nr:MAG: aminoacyl-tRNA deacylase [Desulfuromonadales bacterium C00003068]
MAKEKFPTTAAIRQLKQHKVNYAPHLYPYEEKGGTRASSTQLGVDENCVIKTLVMEDENKHPLIILMHGTCEVSTKELARTLNVKRITPCSPQIAQKHSGYQVGGTSPFGLLKPLPVYVEQSILECGKIYINGGKRGFLVSLQANTLTQVLLATAVNVAINH